MQNKDLDWKILRGAVIAITASLILSGLMLGGSFYFADQMNKNFKTNNSSLQSAKSRYLAMDDEERQIKKYYPIFVGLYHKGILGQEHRLNWIEVLTSAGDELKLPALTYQIATQAIHTPAPPVNPGRYQVYASTMALNMQLRHEGDLFRLFAALDAKAHGIYTVSSCNLIRSADALADAKDVAAITAQCDLQWFTIKLADGAKLEL